jgi:hypothetical protein
MWRVFYSFSASQRELKAPQNNHAGAEFISYVANKFGANAACFHSFRASQRDLKAP